MVRTCCIRADIGGVPVHYANVVGVYERCEKDELRRRQRLYSIMVYYG